MAKKRPGCLLVLAVVAGGACALIVVLALVLATHTQIIVGAIQLLSAGAVKTTNTFEPEGEPVDAVRDNGQRIITKITYADECPQQLPGHHLSGFRHLRAQAHAGLLPWRWLLWG